MTDADLFDRVEVVAREELIPYSNNPKEHPAEQVNKIASSIKNYGWDQPIVVDADGEIIKGHGRLQAAEKLGIDEVPVIWREDLSDAEARAARIADNKTAESAWDDDLLAAELDVLDDFEDIELGFDEGEVDDLLDNVGTESVEELSEPPLEDKALEDVRILNLYAGIGGNRKLWGDEPDVTAVEYNETIAEAYQDHYPDDTVVVDDAHEYLLEHFDEFDFIWTSPPCPTHSQLRKNLRYEQGLSEDNDISKIDAVYPDMRLYEEILLLQGYYDGLYVVENVEPWYDPLIEPQASGRHMFWSNFDIPELDTGPTMSRDGSSVMDSYDPPEQAEEFGYDYEKLKTYKFPDDYPRAKVINNMVHPEVGKTILESALNDDL
jgi:DNA (cytosine-5)-methyltransferase 1